MKRRQLYQKRHLNRADFFERKFIPVINKALMSQIKAFVADMRQNGVSAALNKMDYLIANNMVSEALMKLYKTVAVFFANDKYRQIMEQVPQKGFGFNESWAEEVINYFRLFLLNKATIPITQTTKDQIRMILIQGEKEGLGIEEMAKRLLDTDLTLWRARMIVRTEIAKAAFKGREMGKEKVPYQLTSEWIAASDHRTRHSHSIVDGVVVKVGEKFVVPVYKRVGKVDVQTGVDLMTGPGDPQASKGNVINCRCTTAERVVFDEEGNPVYKQSNVLV